MAVENRLYLQVYPTENEQGSDETLSSLAEFCWPVEERHLTPFLDPTYFLQFLLLGSIPQLLPHYERGWTNGSLVTDLSATVLQCGYYIISAFFLM